MSRKAIAYLVLLLAAATLPVGELEAQFFDASCKDTFRKCKSCIDNGNAQMRSSTGGAGGARVATAGSAPCAGGRAGGFDHREVERLARLSAVAWAANGTQIRALLLERANGGLPDGELLAGLDRLAEVGPSKSLERDLGVLRQAQRELNAAARNDKASVGTAAKVSAPVATEKQPEAHELAPAIERAPTENTSPALRPDAIRERQLH